MLHFLHCEKENLVILMMRVRQEKLGMKKANDVIEYNHIEWTPFIVK